MEEQINDFIKNVKKGCPTSYQPVVLFYQDKIYNHCLRMLRNAHEAEDLTQETFLRAYMHIESFDDDRKFSTWLFRIASNLTIDRLRKRKPDYYLDAEVKEGKGLTMYSQLASSISTPIEEAESKELKRFIYSEIEKLPPIYRQVIELRFFEGFSLKDMSEVLNAPTGTVKARLFRARKTLKKQLMAYDEPLKQEHT